MFVINSTPDNSLMYVSGSGYSDLPIDGSTYNMFFGCNEQAAQYTSPNCRCYCTNVLQLYNCYCCGDITRGFTPNGNGKHRDGCEWNGCGSMDSLLDYSPVKSLDYDVILPCYYTENDNLYQINSGYMFCFYASGIPAEYKCCGDFCFDVCIDEHLINRAVSRKVFDSGICVGKKINGYVGAWFNQAGYLYKYNSSYQYAKGLVDGIEFYLDIGLLHCDGTKTSILCKTIKSACITGPLDFCGYGIYSMDSDCYDVYRDCCGTYNPVARILYGPEETEGATTQQGDRIYVDIGNNSLSTKYKYCGKCLTSSIANCSLGMVEQNMCVIFLGFTQHLFGTSFNDRGYSGYVRYPEDTIYNYASTSAMSESSGVRRRSPGIQISIE